MGREWVNSPKSFSCLLCFKWDWNSLSSADWPRVTHCFSWPKLDKNSLSPGDCPIITQMASMPKVGLELRFPISRPFDLSREIFTADLSMKRCIISYVIRLQDQKNKYQSNISTCYIFHPGYTRKCLNCSTRYCTTFHTCPNGQDLCFKRWYEGNQLGWRAIRGCAATCPEAKTRETVECCTTDKCNK
uniref:Uncharacterized protein n=1 Tax=Naja naja TaxID=35670 RepID=A0A8C7DVX6_NAJNA